MSTELLSDILRVKKAHKISSNDTLIFAYIYSQLDFKRSPDVEGDFVSVRQKDIADQLGISLRTTVRSIQTLLDEGLISKENPNGLFRTNKMYVKYFLSNHKNIEEEQQ